MPANYPALALTFLGVLMVVLGPFAPAIEVAVIGLVAIGFAGVLQVLTTRNA